MKISYIVPGEDVINSSDVSDGTTAEAFLKSKLGSDATWSDYTMYVNHVVVDPSYVLHDGDTISVTNKKYGGARR